MSSEVNFYCTIVSKFLYLCKQVFFIILCNGLQVPLFRLGSFLSKINKQPGRNEKELHVHFLKDFGCGEGHLFRSKELLNGQLFNLFLEI